MRSVLLQLQIGYPLECTAWSNVPTTNGVQITVYTNLGASPNVQQCARNCFLLLEQSLVAMGGIRELAPCFQDFGRIFGAYTCGGAVQGLHKRVLIYIADGSGTVDDVNIAQYFLAPNSTIIPIIDKTIGRNPIQILPNSFNTTLAEYIDNFNTSAVIPRIFRGAGIQSKNFRLFISYKHDDAKAIAGQLFHALSERMFDVFLDRFSSRTGDEFVSLIKEELFNKACVLVLETNDIGSSVYCRQEVATATAYNLGLMAVDLPGSRFTFPQIRKRLNLSGSSLAPNNELNGLDLQNLINFIEQNYDHEIARRLRHQDKTLIDSILAVGLRPQPIGIGQYRVQKNGNEYLLSMSACPPNVDDFIDIERLAQQAPPASQAILFGPISVVRTIRASQISWLGKKSSVNPIDEGHVMRSIKTI